MRCDVIDNKLNGCWRLYKPCFQYDIARGSRASLLLRHLCEMISIRSAGRKLSNSCRILGLSRIVFLSNYAAGRSGCLHRRVKLPAEMLTVCHRMRSYTCDCYTVLPTCACVAHFAGREL